jgi:hypothetical protein
MYGSLLAFPAMCTLLTGWLDRLFDVLGKQRLALCLEGAHAFVVIPVFFVTLGTGFGAVWAIALYSVLTGMYNLFWLVVAFRICNFRVYSVIRLIVSTVLSCLGFVLLWLSAAHVFSPLGTVFSYAIVTIGFWVTMMFRARSTVFRQ